MTVDVFPRFLREKWVSTRLWHFMKGKMVERGKEAINPEGAIAAENPRDKALISVLYESGCRIGEILSLKIRNVEFDNNGSVVIVR